VGYAVEILAGLIELIGWRRIGWLLGVAASAAVLAVAAANLGTQSHAPVGVTVGAVALALFTWRAVAARRRRRRRSAHPESWLESGREDAESSPLARLRRGRLAAWALPLSPRAGWRGRQVTGNARRRSPYAIRRGR
jgi:drug/metabolite transporter (DMT)-like permease